MSIRDQEIRRLEKYAEGLGAKIKYKQHKGDHSSGAEWVLDEDGNTELIMYTWPNQSKTLLILNFVHELAHHVSWIYSNRKEDPETFEAFYKEDLRKKQTDPKLPKEERRLIYLSEKEDAAYRDIIWHEVNIKIPKWKLIVDKKLDIFVYRWYYQKGNTPDIKVIKKKKKELVLKYGNKV